MKRKATKTMLVPGTWWALVRSPRSLPVLFSDRQAARENLDFDEYEVRVHVTPAVKGKQRARPRRAVPTPNPRKLR